MQTFSELELQGFVARGLLAFIDKKAEVVDRAIMRDAKQLRYREEQLADLLLIETCFGERYNTSQSFVLYGDGRSKALWRLSVDTWWDKEALERYDLDQPPEEGEKKDEKSAFSFFDQSRRKGLQLNRVIGFKKYERVLSSEPLKELRFCDNGINLRFSRFIGDLSIKLRMPDPTKQPDPKGLMDHHREYELGEAFYQGGRF